MVGPLSHITAQAVTAPKTPELPVAKTQPSAFDAKLEAKSIAANIVHSIEAGGMRVDAILKTAMNKTMSNGELLAMQAGMYRYTQELDLCSKVVDKAVNGLRDVLKTQV